MRISNFKTKIRFQSGEHSIERMHLPRSVMFYSWLSIRIAKSIKWRIFLKKIPGSGRDHPIWQKKMSWRENGTENGVMWRCFAHLWKNFSGRPWIYCLAYKLLRRLRRVIFGTFSCHASICSLEKCSWMRHETRLHSKTGRHLPV